MFVINVYDYLMHMNFKIYFHHVSFIFLNEYKIINKNITLKRVFLKIYVRNKLLKIKRNK